MHEYVIGGFDLGGVYEGVWSFLCGGSSYLLLWSTDGYAMLSESLDLCLVTRLHPALSCAASSIFLQLYLKPAVHISFSSSRLHVFFGRPLPVCPCAVHCSACLAMLSPLFLSVWSSQFHFLFSAKPTPVPGRSSSIVPCWIFRLTSGCLRDIHSQKLAACRFNLYIKNDDINWRELKSVDSMFLLLSRCSIACGHLKQTTDVWSHESSICGFSLDKTDRIIYLSWWFSDLRQWQICQYGRLLQVVMSCSSCSFL